MKLYTCPGCKQETLKAGGDSPENEGYPHCPSCGWNGKAYLSNSPKARAARVAKVRS